MINQNNVGSPDITPNPAIHTDPTQATSATQPLDAQTTQAQGQSIADGTAANVVLQLTGVSTGPGGANAALQNFGQEVLANIDNTDGLTQTVTANTAAIQAMQNQDAADSNNGVNVFVDFSTGNLSGFTLTSIPTSYATVVVSGGAAVLQPSGSSNCTAWELYTDTPTSTDYQLISAVYATSPPVAPAGYNILVGRSNASLTTFVYVTLARDGVINLHNVVSGTDTVVASTTIGAFYPGAPYALQCGIEGSANTYNVLVNGSAVLSWVDTGSVTNIGASYRYCGFGLAQFAAKGPSKVAAFGFVDDSPASIIGDAFKAYCATTSPIALSSVAVTQLFPSNFFGTVAEQTSNYTYDPSTNKITVAKSCIYVADIGAQWVNNGTPVYTYFGPALYKNGTLFQQRQTPSYGWTSTVPYYLVASGSFKVPLNAGDYIQPAYWSYCASGTNYIIGDASGETVIFSCNILNTGTGG